MALASVKLMLEPSEVALFMRMWTNTVGLDSNMAGFHNAQR
jgi:hypothetical protein